MIKREKTKRILKKAIPATLIVGCCFVILLERITALRTISVEQLAGRVPPHLAFLSFEYSHDMMESLAELANSLGVLPHIQMLTGMSEPRSSKSKISNIGARGFVVADLDSSLAGITFKRLDQLAASYFEALDQQEHEEWEEENDSAPETAEEEDEEEFESLVADPLYDAVDTIWNGSLLTLGAAIQLDLSFVDKFKLGAQMLTQSDETFLKSLLVRAIPLKLQKYFVHEALDLASFNEDFDDQSGVHHGIVTLSVEGLESLVDNLCPESSIGWDACSTFEWDRDAVRETAADLMELVDDTFELELDFFWAVKGTTLVWSNNSSWVEATLNNETLPERNRSALASIVSSKKNPMSTGKREPKQTALTVASGANMKRLEHNILQAVAWVRTNIRKKTLLTSDYFESAQSEEFLADAEEYALSLPQLAPSLAVVLRLGPSSLTPELWLARSASESDDEKIFRGEATSTLYSIMSALLLPKTNLSRQGFIPYSQISQSQLGSWLKVEGEIVPSSIAPLVQKRMRHLDKESRGLF